MVYYGNNKNQRKSFGRPGRLGPVVPADKLHCIGRVSFIDGHPLPMHMMTVVGRILAANICCYSCFYDLQTTGCFGQKNGGDRKNGTTAAVAQRNNEVRARIYEYIKKKKTKKYSIVNRCIYTNFVRFCCQKMEFFYYKQLTGLGGRGDGVVNRPAHLIGVKTN